MNSRWGSRGVRHSKERMIEDSRWVKDRNGQWRREESLVNEEEFCNLRHEPHGWHGGAKVRVR